MVAQGPKFHVFGTSFFPLVDVKQKTTISVFMTLSLNLRMCGASATDGCARKIPYRACMSLFTHLSAVTMQRSWTSSKKKFAGV